jgi:hypothetical protein
MHKDTIFTLKKEANIVDMIKKRAKKKRTINPYSDFKKAIRGFLIEELTEQCHLFM